MNPEFWKAHTLGLPRWAWAAMLIGGVGLGLYFRHHNTGEPKEEPEGENGYRNSGNLMPPGSPIESGGGGGGGGIPSVPIPGPFVNSEKPYESHTIELPEPAVELPESVPPPERTIDEPVGGGSNRGGEAVQGRPINGKPGPGIGPGHPVQEHSPEKEKALAEISRLNSEIGGLQNHIAQLTSVLQQYPHADKRGQWDSERNQDRANIEHKREEISHWQGKL